jgi:hypothetical protein
MVVAMSRLKKLLVMLAATFLLLVGVLLAWPESAPVPLVPADGWQVSGSFEPTHPTDNGVRRRIATNPQARFWKSWSADTGSGPGVVRSAPFMIDGPVVVPYNGFSGDPGLDTYLECASSGQRRFLATQRTNTQWSEVFVEPVSDWCPGPVRIVAESSTDANYVSLGTPFRVSRLSAFKRSPVAALWYLLLAWLVVFGWLAAVFERVDSKRGSVSAIAAALICFGLLGYLQFFAFWLSPSAGQISSAAIVVAGLCFAGRQVVGAGARSDGLVEFRCACSSWLLVAIAILMLGMMVDAGAGAWSANGRFYPVRWSTDNQVPYLAANSLISGTLKGGAWLGSWKMSDRPPLAYGWNATLQALFQLFSPSGDSDYLGYLYQWAVGVVLNTLWIALLVILLRRLRFSMASATSIALLVLLTPFGIFNTMFVWPKMLSATFGLMAAWLLLSPDRPSRPLRDDGLALVAAAALSALALMSHGGSVFGIVASIVLTAAWRGLPTARAAIAAACVGAAVLLPWSLWQHFVDPPGTALIKKAFAGTFGFGERDIGVLETIRQSYSTLTLHDWIVMKWNGLSTLFLGMGSRCGMVEVGVSHSITDSWRISDFFYVFPGLNFLLVGFVAMIWLARKIPQMVPAASLRLLTFALLTLTLSWLSSWDCFINHHQSYQAMIALYAALAIALWTWGPLGKAALALNVAYVSWVWLIEPLRHFYHFSVSAIVLFAMAIAGIALVAKIQAGQETPA